MAGGESLKLLLVFGALAKSIRILSVLILASMLLILAWEFRVARFSLDGLNLWVLHATGNTEISKAWLDFGMLLLGLVILYIVARLTHNWTRTTAKSQFQTPQPAPARFVVPGQKAV